MEAITKARKMQSHIMQLMYLIAYDNIPPPPKKKTRKKTNKKKKIKKKITLMLPHPQPSVQGYHSVRKKNIH